MNALLAADGFEVGLGRGRPFVRWNDASERASLKRDTDQRDEQAAEPHTAQERHRNHQQGQQTDRDCYPGGQHRSPCGAHRDHDRGVIVVAMSPLLAPARDHQQGVVDTHTEPDERDEDCTTKLTSVSSVRSSTSKNVVRIETAAMTNGTSAKKDAKTKVSTTSAPTAPNKVSTSTLGPALSPPADSSA